MAPRKPKEKEVLHDEIVSQCPECRSVKVAYAKNKGRVKEEPSVAVLPSAKKELCWGCTQKYKIDL